MARNLCPCFLLALILVVPCLGEDSASLHYKAGLDAWNAGKVDIAIYEWQNVLRLKPDSSATKDRLLEALMKRVQQLENEIKLLRGTSRAASQPSGTAPEARTGTVKGTITFGSPRLAGDRPDVGTQVWLVDGSTPPYSADRDTLVQEKEFWLLSKAATEIHRKISKELTDETLKTGEFNLEKTLQARRETWELAEKDEGKTRFRILQETVCDGNGNYEFEKVAPGTYTIVIRTSSSSFSDKYWTVISVTPESVVNASKSEVAGPWTKVHEWSSVEAGK
jgi:hypothetical protein